jgi:hypothetical protein
MGVKFRLLSSSRLFYITQFDFKTFKYLEPDLRLTVNIR